MRVSRLAMHQHPDKYKAIGRLQKAIVMNYLPKALGPLRRKRRFQVSASRIRLRRVGVLAEHGRILPPRHISLIQKVIHLARVEITAALEIFADGRLGTSPHYRPRRLRHSFFAPWSVSARPNQASCRIGRREIPRLLGFLQQLLVLRDCRFALPIILSKVGKFEPEEEITRISRRSATG